MSSAPASRENSQANDDVKRKVKKVNYKSSKALMMELEAREEMIKQQEKERERQRQKAREEEEDLARAKVAKANLPSSMPAGDLPRVRNPADLSDMDDGVDEDELEGGGGQGARMRRRFKHWREFIFFKEFVVYSVFLVLFVAVSLSARPSGYSFWMKDKILDQLTDEEFLPADVPNLKKTFMDIGNNDEFWQWIKGPLPENLYPTDNYWGEPMTVEETHYLVRQNRRIGASRLRQLRTRRGVKCVVPPKFLKLLPECGGGYTASREDRTPFGPASNPTKYQYQSRSELNGVPTWGFIEATYGGGGYVTELPDSPAEFQSAVQELMDDQWIDNYTRAVFLEFTLFNPGVNLFCVSSMLVEFPVIGGAYPNPSFRMVRLFRYQTVTDYVRLAFEILLILFVLYYLFEEGLEMRIQGVAYLKSVWNWYDMINLLLFIVVIIIRIVQVYKEDRLEINNYDAIYGAKFINFQDVAYLASQEVNINACNAFLCWFKIFKYVKMSKRLSQLSRTLSRAGLDIANFLLMFMIVFFGYAHMGYMLFGSDIKGFRSYGVCLITLFRAIMGDFDFEAANSSNRLVGPIFYISFMILVIMVLLNMFLAIINASYTIVTTEDETRVTLLNFSAFFEESTQTIASAFGWISKEKAQDLSDKLADKTARDTNKDGRIDAKELRAALGGEDDVHADKIMKAYDVDNDGTLSITEYDRLRADLKSRAQFEAPGAAEGMQQPPPPPLVSSLIVTTAGAGAGAGASLSTANQGSASRRGSRDGRADAAGVHVVNQGTATAMLYAKMESLDRHFERVLTHLDLMSRNLAHVSEEVSRAERDRQTEADARDKKVPAPSAAGSKTIAALPSLGPVPPKL